MTDNIKHSTSYYHEAIAHAFEMFKNGYEPVMETPFQPRRLGSAFVTEYKPVRESLDEAHELTIQQKWEMSDAIEAEFDKMLEESAPLPSDLLYKVETWKKEAEANRDKENGIFKRIVESIESAQSNPEGCVSKIVEVDNEEVKVYSKSELENMEWVEFKKLIDAAGIRGRRRQNLTRDYLIYQEENLKLIS